MMTPHTRNNKKPTQERGLALLEVIMGLVVITIGLVAIERVLHERAHVRQQAAHISDYRMLVEHIAMRAAAHNALFEMAESGRRILQAAELRAHDFISGRMAERITLMGEARDYGVVFERRANDVLRVHLALYGGAALDETRLHAVMRTHLPRTGSDPRLEGFDADTIAEMRLVVSHETMLVPHTQAGGSEIELTGNIPAALARSFHLKRHMKEWWLHPEHSPATFDLALKLLDGWTLETADETQTHMEVALPSCHEHETPFVLAAPKSALGPVRQARGTAVNYHTTGKPIVIADSWPNPTREIRITPIENRRAHPVYLKRAGGVPIYPRNNHNALAGLSSEGTLRLSSGTRSSLGEQWRAEHESGSLITSSHAFSLFHESKPVEFMLRTAKEIGANTYWASSSLDAYTPPRARIRRQGATQEARWERNWVPPAQAQAEHVRADMTTYAFVSGIYLNILRQSRHITNAYGKRDPDTGERLVYYPMKPGNVDSTYRHIARTLQIGAMDGGATLDATPGADDDVPDGALLLDPGQRIATPQGGRVRLPAPAHTLPQAMNADEFIISCTNAAQCMPLRNARSYRGFYNTLGLFNLARNDPAVSKNKRPGGALHFGKLYIHYPNSELNISKLCL